MVVTKWTNHKDGNLPVTILVFWKFYLSLRTSYKELIWCTNEPNTRICTFFKRWSFISKKQKLINTLRLNFCYLKIIRFLHICYHLKIVGHILKNLLKKKYICSNEISWLIIMKMKIKMRNRSHGYDRNRPRPRHGHKCIKF